MPQLTLTLLFTLCRLEFLENLDIVSMFSSEGEKVKLSQSISTSAARGAVEKWLLQVQDVMIISVRDVIEQARDVSCISSSFTRGGRGHGTFTYSVSCKPYWVLSKAV